MSEQPMNQSSGNAHPEPEPAENFPSISEALPADWDEQVRALKARSFKSWVLVTLFQGLAKVPLRVRMGLGWLLGHATPILVRRRARIVARNLELCFPDLSEAERKRLFTLHFRALAQTMVDRGILWFGSPQDVESLVETKGLDHLLYFRNRRLPVMMLAPHFVGLDAAASRLTLIGPEGGTLYTPQRDPDVDALVRLGRARFHKVHLISRREGIRGLVRVIKNNLPIYYLPDMDFGHKGAVFVPFFGMPTATQTSTAQLARQFNLPVVPILSGWNPKTGRYCVEVLPPLSNFPGKDTTLEQDTAHLNELLESWIRKDPSQYYWVHRRFKTRPDGQPDPYSKNN
jgi:KDO2-lipid IV(A) lauroyltransferase